MQSITSVKPLQEARPPCAPDTDDAGPYEPPADLEVAWYAGLQNGLEFGPEDAPEGYDAVARHFYSLGYQSGINELARERMEWAEAFERYLDETHVSPEPAMADIERRGVAGHPEGFGWEGE